ncbi:hypothetical protein [Paenibacillus sinopodophylli]|uniref:hypothetical protein n=1 Tax=Paenibacillus sinopodophylli TaxID=1837342 RepID=UPI00110CA72B|nr:hypothetical protein [Paenibacillus sinopodophylli]
MKFIHDYRHFIEVGCTACGRKHTVSKGKYNVTMQGYSFHTPLACTCGSTASTASKENRTWTSKAEQHDIPKRNKATTVKMMLVIGFVIVFFAVEMNYMFHS